tara:strand:+ start:874 stop:996 length:123 start_codon:yes stop_codon:yes gene_type:complete
MFKELNENTGFQISIKTLLANGYWNINNYEVKTGINYMIF